MNCNDLMRSCNFLSSSSSSGSVRNTLMTHRLVMIVMAYYCNGDGDSDGYWMMTDHVK